MFRRQRVSVYLLVSLLLAAQATAQTNGLLREVWLNIGGGTVADLTNNAAFPGSPSFDEVLANGFEAPTDVYESYGQRLRALLIPPATGSYVFLIASDDASQLFLSTNDAPAGKRIIARVNNWTSPRQYHVEAGQKSAAVQLTAGQRYYIEALMKEGGGGDNLAVTWQKPGEAEPTDGSAPIPLGNLVPYGIGPPAFATHPASVSVVESGTAYFSAQLTRSLSASLQWVRNGTNIPGATSSSLAIGPLRLSDSGSTLYCRAVNSYGATNSNPATLTVTADTSPPRISSAVNLGAATLVTVAFSEAVDPATAGNPNNYLINSGISVLGATLLEDGATVVLRTTPLTSGAGYLLTVNNVRDLAQTPNTILPNSQASFSFSYTPVPLQWAFGTNEPAGPSSRRSPLAITEIMFHPTNRPDGRNLEFIEIYNSNPWAEDLGGHRISGSVGYTFGTGTTIPALGYRVVAANPADIQAVYGLSGVLGPLTNSTPGNATNVLDNGGGTLRLRDELDAVLLEVAYGDAPPWPVAADGAGHSLVLWRPSYGEGDPQAWAASDRVGGSPGAYDSRPALAVRSVVINEILAHTDPPQEDFVELFNYSSSPVAIGGCVLTDDPATNRFVIAAGTSIPARGFLAFTQTQLGFALDASGETIYLLAADGSRVLQALRFGSQENGVAFGRYPDGAPAFRRLSAVTQGTNNASALASSVVINEVHYNPASGDDNEEFVEIYNRGTTPVALGKWRLGGGISFTFPTNASIPAGGYLVVAGSIPGLLAAHPALNPSLVYGGFSGRLGNGGDVVRLDKPDDLVSTNGSGQLVTNKIHIVVDEVAYGTGGRWSPWAGGGGSSLERIDPRADGNLAPNWKESDETSKSGWTTVEFTGVLDNGAMSGPDQLQIFLLGPGECLVDDVEVIPQGGGNVVANGGFDTGADGWFFQGTHEDSLWQATGGVSGGCLYVVASDRGDPGANRIRTVLTQAPAEGSTATLRAKVRWLKGHPELLLRLRGNWLEAAGNILATRNLGSPGAANTRFRANSGPAITDVRHWPVLPAAGQSVTVLARIEDPDGICQATLKYRIDPSTNFVTVALSPCGAGLFSGVIPGQAAGTRAAFYLEARDAFTPTALSRFPDDSPARECLVGFGETTPAGSFASYRLWVTQRNVTRWASREKQSNRALDATFVYAGCRVCYNTGTLYSGSPFHTPGYNSPDGNLCDYEVMFPKDDQLLGTDDFLLATVGNLNSDPTFQAEQTAFWVTRSLGTPYLNRRYIRVFFNGQMRATAYEDAQQPNGEIVSQFFPDDDQGSLHKIEDWFEFNDVGDNMLGNIDATLQNFTTTGGAKKTARYRWNWRPRAAQQSANAFTNLFTLVDAMNTAQPDLYRSWVAGLVSVEEFMRVLATERLVGNWDSYGYARGKNMFIYKPKDAPWQLLPWDIDFVFSSGGAATTDPLFGSNEPVIDTLRAFPEFQRAYWRAFADAANGPLQPTALSARLDPRYSALSSAGIGPSSPQALKDYAAQRRSYLLGQLATVASPFAVSQTMTVSNGMGVITGTAPVGVATLVVNGASWPVRWTTVSNWTAVVPLLTGSNFFSVTGIDNRGQTVAGASNSVSFNYGAAVPSPVGVVVLNEILFNPLVPDAEYLELYNTSATSAFDLSGWNVNGLSYVFPSGTILQPRSFLILAKNRSAFAEAYGIGIPVFDEYDGNLQADGETLSLLKPAMPAGTFTVVDRVRYEAVLPWAPAAPGTSLQLCDPAQDNARVANWSSGGTVSNPTLFIPLMDFTNVWKFMQVSNLDGVNWTASAFNDASWPVGPGLLAYENNASIVPLIRTNLNPPNQAINNAASGHAYYFRTRVVAATNLAGLTVNAGVYLDDGAVFYVNGVEAARIRVATNVVVTNLTMTTEQPPGGDALNPDVFTLDPALFVVGTNVIAVEVHQNNTNSSDITFGLRLTADRLGYTNSLAPASPGASNSVAATLPAFPTLWLNEVQPENLSGPVDNAGQREPWVELFNPGPAAINLGGYYLADNYTNLSLWAFPSNASVAAGGFLVAWCDGQTNQSAGSALHAGFRLASGNGRIALSRKLGNTVQLVDYFTYTSLRPDWTYGDLPDAQPFYRDAMFQATPGATNSAASPPLTVFINEWMADNTLTLADPADGNYEDWFEIYNPGTNTVDLGGFYLTDNLTNKFQFMIPDNGHYLIPPGGFLVVWADNETGQNSTNRPDLHAGFALSKGGEAIGIFAADGSTIDTVTFIGQAADVSQGRYRDGSTEIFTMPQPTPGAPNVLPNTPPTLTPIPNQQITLGQTLVLAVAASDGDIPEQQLLFSLDAASPPTASINPVTGFFSWTPTAAPATNQITVIVTDNGSPSLAATWSFNVLVYPPPTLETTLTGAGQMQLSWPRGTLQEADEPGGPYRDVTDHSPVTIDLTETQKFFRIRL